MELSRREELSFELANHQLAGEEKAKSTQLMGGFSCNETAMRHVKLDKLSAITHRATTNIETKEPGKALRTNLQ